MENIWIWVVIGVLLWQGMTLLQFLLFLYYKFRFNEHRLIQRNEVEDKVWKLVAPYEKYLFEKGFVFKYSAVSKSSVVGSDLLIHRFYYYNEEQGVHAFLETTPYKGSAQSVKIAFDTVYESKYICTTENGVEHFIPAVPQKIYFFDHYLASWEEVYERHLEDREIENEIILKQSFTQEGWLAYMSYGEESYIDAFVETGIAKKIEEGYKYRASLALWKFAKKSIQGQRKFVRILKENSQNRKMDTISKDHHTEGLLTQMNQEDKARGEGSNKKLWFAGSMIAFVVLFGILGFSLVDIAILVAVLFVHELGHYLAMRFFGYTDTSIFFLPFGAVTIGHKQKRKAYEEFIVSLMGPLPGLLIGLGLIAYEIFYHHRLNGESYLGMYAMMSLIINYINLLPIYPLDGGRILQTLLLLRYPKGQFYFYLIGLAVLTAAMVWLRDPLLLVFVVLVALGLKQSYKISQLLQKLFGKYKQEEITQDRVASMLVEDESFAKETLASKSKIGKQAMLIVETKKPSKLLSIFGLGFYLLLLLPPLLLASFGMTMLYQNDYAKLTDVEKKEIEVFYSTVENYKSLSDSVEQNISMRKTMQRLDDYFSEHNISQPKPFEGRFPSVYPCDIPEGLKSLYRWHNGVNGLLGYEILYSVEKMQENYSQILKAYPELNMDWVPVSTIFKEEGMAWQCGKKGLYRYVSESKREKVYYSTAHLLQISADAFENGAYFFTNNEIYVDYHKLNAIKEKYLSVKDKKRRKALEEYLEQKAVEHYKDDNSYFKRIIIWEMQALNKKCFLSYLKVYANDKDDEVAQMAKDAIGSISKEGERLSAVKMTAGVI